MTSLIGIRQASRLGSPTTPRVAIRPATGPEVKLPDQRLLWSRAGRVGARGRLQSELASIAADLLGPTDPDELPAACADWIDTTIEDAVSRASDAALGTLMQGLESGLVGLPPEVARWLRRARTRQETGVF